MRHCGVVGSGELNASNVSIKSIYEKKMQIRRWCKGLLWCWGPQASFLKKKKNQTRRIRVSLYCVSS